MTDAAANVPQQPAPQPEELVRRTLALLHLPGSVFEVRILGIRGRGKPHPAAGYFNDHEAAVKAILTFDERVQPEGIYTTLNELNPGVLARIPNRVQNYPEFATADLDVTRRRWLFLDFDPKRPKGISSTREELDAAKTLADRLHQWLAEEFGWPAPLEALSGNGVHHLQRLDLDNTKDATNLLTSVIKTLALKADELRDPQAPLVELDTSVMNASRLTKVYGTVARKGTHTEERPHRRSRILSLPDPMELLPLERLEAVARLASASPQVKRATQIDNRPSHRLDVGRWLSERGYSFSLKSSPTADGRTVFLLERCPFDPEHGRRGEVAVMQGPDGGLSAKCFHASCEGKGWQAFKAAIGAPSPEHYDPPLPQAHSDAAHASDLLRQAIFAIAGACDGASARDGMGFNRNDSPVGHALAEKARRGEPWTLAEAKDAFRMCSYYWKQLRQLGINSELIIDPAIAEGEKVLTSLEEEAKKDPRAAVRKVLESSDAIANRCSSHSPRSCST